jgi:hypothetical protein
MTAHWLVECAAALAACSSALASTQREGRRNEQRGREAGVRGAFTSTSMVQPRRVETTRHRCSEGGRP